MHGMHVGHGACAYLHLPLPAACLVGQQGLVRARSQVQQLLVGCYDHSSVLHH